MRRNEFHELKWLGRGTRAHATLKFPAVAQSVLVSRQGTILDLDAHKKRGLRLAISQNHRLKPSTHGPMGWHCWQPTCSICATSYGSGHFAPVYMCLVVCPSHRPPIIELW